MSIIKEGKNIIGVYKGDIPILRIYKGTNLVFNQQIDYDITATFDVTSTTEPTKLYNSGIAAMSIDNVYVGVTSAYTFNTLGEHTVQYKLNDKENLTDNAFDGCSSLTSVIIPSSVTSIGKNAFYYCTSLTSVTIPSSVTSIADYAFWNCSSLTSIELPSSLTSISWGTFRACSSLTSVTIPNSVTSIGYESFRGCASLKSVTIGNSVTSIYSFSFYNCKSLTSIEIPSSVTSISDYAFKNCSGLTEITCNSTSAPTIGTDVFNGVPSSGTLIYPCESDYSTWLTQLAWEDTCNSSPYDITSTFNVTSTTSPTQLCYSSATSAFTEMYVDDVKIDVTSAYTFNTTGEHTVNYMLADKTKIVDSSFQDCSNLISIVIPDSVTSVGTYSFFGCSSLTSIDFGKGIKTIGNAVFYYCSSLTSIVIPSSVETIGINAFNTCIFYKDNFINNSSATGYPWSAVIYDTIQDDGLYINGTTVVGCKKNATNVTIQESITDIGDGAFFNCSSLTEITCLPTTAPTLNGNVFIGLPASGTLTYPCESDYSAWLTQLAWEDTCNQGGQEKWVTLTKDTARNIQMQTFRIDTTTTPTTAPESGEDFITFSTSPDYPGENAYLTDFSICIREDRIYDNGSRKYISDQKHIEGNVYEYTFSVPVYFAGGERNAPLSQVQYKTTSGDTPEEPVEEGIPDYNVTNYDVKARFDVTSTTSQIKLCYSSMTTAFTEMYIDGEPYGVSSGYTFNTTGKHTVHYVLKDNTILTSNAFAALFQDCSDLEEMVIKDSVKTINDKVFNNCSKLKKITFGSGLTKIGSGTGVFAKPVFSGCTSLNEITCYATTSPTLTTKALNGIESNGGVLHIPQGSDYSTWTNVLKSWTIQYIT